MDGCFGSVVAVKGTLKYDYSDSQKYIPQKLNKRRITKKQIDYHSTGFKI